MTGHAPPARLPLEPLMPSWLTALLIWFAASLALGLLLARIGYVLKTHHRPKDRSR